MMEQNRKLPTAGAGQNNQSERAVYRCLHCGELIVVRSLIKQGLRCPQCANIRMAVEQPGS